MSSSRERQSNQRKQAKHIRTISSPLTGTTLPPLHSGKTSKTPLKPHPIVGMSSLQAASAHSWPWNVIGIRTTIVISTDSLKRPGLGTPMKALVLLGQALQSFGEVSFVVLDVPASKKLKTVKQYQLTVVNT